MPRPWSEASALLAAHGFPAPTEPTPRRRRWRPRMAADIRYALIRPEPGAKPLAFADVGALARHIQRERGTQGLDLVETDDLEIEGDVSARRGVQIYTTDAGNDRDRNLGCAWIDGRGMETLQAAIRRNRLVIIDDSQEAA